MVRFLGRRVRNASCPLHKKVMFLSCFANLARKKGALTIVGPAEMLQKMPLEHVRRATNRLLRPWKEERGASSVGSIGSVLVTSASGVPRGKRHRFRVTAAEFRPDPLNQPGGRGLSSLQWI